MLASKAEPSRALGLHIVSFAPCETPALFGLALHFLGATRDTALGLVFVSLCLLFLCFPPRRQPGFPRKRVA